MLVLKLIETKIHMLMMLKCKEILIKWHKRLSESLGKHKSDLGNGVSVSVVKAPLPHLAFISWFMGSLMRWLYPYSWHTIFLQCECVYDLLAGDCAGKYSLLLFFFAVRPLLTFIYFCFIIFTCFLIFYFILFHCFYFMYFVVLREAFNCWIVV